MTFWQGSKLRPPHVSIPKNLQQRLFVHGVGLEQRLDVLWDSGVPVTCQGRRAYFVPRLVMFLADSVLVKIEIVGADNVLFAQELRRS